MPSKLEHELNKLRGEVSATGEVYTSSIADLKDALTEAEEDIKNLESTSSNLLTKVTTALSRASTGLKLSISAIKNGGNGLIGILQFAILQKYSAATGIVRDEDGNNIWEFENNSSNSNVSNIPISVNTIYEETAHSGVTIDTVLIKDGVVDGLDCSGVEAGATADQTGAEIKIAYQAQANAYTDTKNTKLAGIAENADVTNQTSVLAAGSRNQINLWRVYTSPGTNIAVGTIPAHSYIHRVLVHVTELFNDSGTDLLVVGTVGDTDRFGTTLDVSSTGLTEMGAGAGIGYNSSAQDVVCKYSCQNYNVNQGKALIIVEYETVGAQP